jgi:hypothetical protein
LSRKTIAAVAALAMPLLLVVGAQPGPAQAAPNPVLPGSVTCTAAQGTWSGSIRFFPALRNGGIATTERFAVAATLGNSASPCVTSPGTPQLGKIVGALKFTGPAANACATVFSGTARVPTVLSRFKLTWVTPPGTATVWKQLPAFSVVGAPTMTNITITGGVVNGSFSPFPGPNATLADAGWPATAATACSSTGGLAALTLGTSAGTW